MKIDMRDYAKEAAERSARATCIYDKHRNCWAWKTQAEEAADHADSTKQDPCATCPSNPAAPHMCCNDHGYPCVRRLTNAEFCALQPRPWCLDKCPGPRNTRTFHKPEDFDLREYEDNRARRYEVRPWMLPRVIPRFFPDF